MGIWYGWSLKIKDLIINCHFPEREKGKLWQLFLQIILLFHRNNHFVFFSWWHYFGGVDQMHLALWSDISGHWRINKKQTQKVPFFGVGVRPLLPLYSFLLLRHLSTGSSIVGYLLQNMSKYPLVVGTLWLMVCYCATRNEHEMCTRLDFPKSSYSWNSATLPLMRLLTLCLFHRCRYQMFQTWKNIFRKGQIFLGERKL